VFSTSPIYENTYVTKENAYSPEERYTKSASATSSSSSSSQPVVIEQASSAAAFAASTAVTIILDGIGNANYVLS
jgi:hypothetical protein